MDRFDGAPNVDVPAKTRDAIVSAIASLVVDTYVCSIGAAHEVSGLGTPGAEFLFVGVLDRLLRARLFGVHSAALRYRTMRQVEFYIPCGRF